MLLYSEQNFEIFNSIIITKTSLDVLVSQLVLILLGYQHYGKIRKWLFLIKYFFDHMHTNNESDIFDVVVKNAVTLLIKVIPADLLKEGNVCLFILEK